MKPRLLACALLTLVVAMLAPSAASASSSQLSLLQDDREFLGERGEDLDSATAELKNLGVDILRTNVNYNKIYKTPKDRTKPRDFKTSDPNNSHYDWSATDRLVALARAKGVKLLLTVTGPGPYFSSENPRKCKRLPCTYKPKTREFQDFAAAAATRYRGKADYYAIWNEPNIGKTWLTPRFEKRRGVGTIDYAAAKYRQLYIAGQKAIAKHDPARRNRVLFGEVAAISQPLPFLRSALCLDSRNRPFRGRAGQGHRMHAREAHQHARLRRAPLQPGGQRHPAQQDQDQDVAVDRLHAPAAPPAGRRGAAEADRWASRHLRDRVRLPVQAAGQRLEREPDRAGAVHQRVGPAAASADSRVKWVGQYELTDVRDKDEFNTGLRFVGGTRKPAYAAFRMPIVVTRRSANSVEVYGQSRPGGASTVAIQAQSSGGQFTTVRNVRTNSRGVFRVNVSRKSAFRLKWRLSGMSAATGEAITSRTAKAGKKLGFYKG
ncbi:MAG: hypothetical protein WKF40_12155 [Thermoleophilaceae bacterium]